MKLKEPLLYWLKPGKIQPINYTLFILILARGYSQPRQPYPSL